LRAKSLPLIPEEVLILEYFSKEEETLNLA